LARKVDFRRISLCGSSHLAYSGAAKNNRGGSNQYTKNLCIETENAIPFFGHFGFREDKPVVISGGKFGACMAVHDIEAQHVTLVLPDMHPRQEV
jgi:hypothetical protein